MYANILVPFDGSENALRALKAAVKVGTGAEPVEITVLRVTGASEVDTTTFEVAARMAGIAPVSDDQVEMLKESYIAAHKEQMQKQITDYFDSLPDNVDVKIVVKRGTPRDAICQYAEDNGADCIVMGRRGLGGIRAALGSVSAAVLRETDLPVLVVR